VDKNTLQNTVDFLILCRSSFIALIVCLFGLIIIIFIVFVRGSWQWGRPSPTSARETEGDASRLHLTCVCLALLHSQSSFCSERRRDVAKKGMCRVCGQSLSNIYPGAVESILPSAASDKAKSQLIVVVLWTMLRNQTFNRCAC